MKRNVMYTMTTAGTALALLGIAVPPTTRAQFIAVSGKRAPQSPISRNTLAVSYRDGAETSVDMVGTELSRRSHGYAQLKRKDGLTRIKLKFESLSNPQALSSWYTAYVVWAINPEGQSDNLGQLKLKDARAEFEATTPFQTFGLIVTAEPHPLVKLPGSAMIAENVLRKDTKGDIRSSPIKYQYDNTFKSLTSATTPDFITPLPVLGARRALEIARKAQAYQYAEAELRPAEKQLTILEQTWPRNRNKPTKYTQLALDTVRLAEVAREASESRVATARRDAERRASANQIELARTDARQSQRETEAYRNTLMRTEAELAAARVTLERAQTDTEKAKAHEEVARLESEVARADAERSRSDTERAKQEAGQAKEDLSKARNALYNSVSVLLDTRRESRGLIINLSDIQFDFNKATLKPEAREKLSKLAGILITFSGQLRLDIEGHTDSIGADEYNEKLSLSRAETVRDYLIQSGVSSSRFTPARGFGKANPLASNETATGRQMNRRVEIIIADSELAAPPQP